MEAEYSSKAIAPIYQTNGYYNAGNYNMKFHRRENLKLYTGLNICYHKY
jgi:hypothetical protein